MRVLAAMSGGVDSAVAAARAVDAGHDVTGIHLALSEAPQSLRTGARGCCSVEDSHDARRAADVHRHPVLRLGHGGAVPRAGDGRLRRRVRRRPHAQPVPALQREDQVRRGARPGTGAGLRRRLHRPLRPACRRRAAPRGRRGQGPVLRARRPDRRPAAPRRCSRWATRPRRLVRAEAARRGLAVADKPDSHDICFIADGDTAGFLQAPARRAARRDRRPGLRRGAGQPRRRVRASPSVSARACKIGRPAADGRPRYVLDITPVDGRVSVGPAEALDVDEIVGATAALVRACRRPRARTPCRCAPTAASPPPRSCLSSQIACWSGFLSRCAVWLAARPSCSTTATGLWDPPQSSRPPRSPSYAEVVTTDRGYLLDNAQREAGLRFGALSELFDPSTFRHMRSASASTMAGTAGK